MKQQTNIYRTKDLYESGYLLASGKLKLIEVQSEGNSKVCFFLFEPRGKAEELSVEYWNKTGEISAREYADSLRVLKDRIFNKR